MIHCWHLAKRFFFSIVSRRATASEIIWLKCFLSTAEVRHWLRLVRSDQRHSLTVAKRFIDLRPKASIEEIAAALLHDIGKVDSKLGTFGRVFAAILGQRTDRFSKYLEHESIGLRLLEGIGTNSMTIELLRGKGDADVVRLLQQADNI